MHAYTGCDTTSAFSGRGKKLAFQLITKQTPKGELARKAMAALSASFDALPADIFACIEQFTCGIYGFNTATSINEVRYQMFCSRSTQSSSLPPCQDALRKHAARANYQASIWHRALEASADVPPPHSPGQGWTIDSGGGLEVDWLSLAPAPLSLMEFVSCGCTTGCKHGHCSCRRQHLNCTDACKCSHSGQECGNGQPLELQVTAELSEDEDE